MLMNHVYVRVEGLNEDGSADPTHSENAPRTAALFDFNLAVILRPGQKRLPWRFGNTGWCYAFATDLGLGEYDYDPFAYDVYALGSVLIEYYSVSKYSYIHPCLPRSDMLPGVCAYYPDVGSTACWNDLSRCYTPTHGRTGTSILPRSQERAHP